MIFRKRLLGDKQGGRYLKEKKGKKRQRIELKTKQGKGGGGSD